MKRLVGVGVEGEEGRRVAGLLFVLVDVVLQLLELRLHLVGDVVALGLADGQPHQGGGDLEDLVLGLAALLREGVLVFDRSMAEIDGCG